VTNFGLFHTHTKTGIPTGNICNWLQSDIWKLIGNWLKKNQKRDFCFRCGTGLIAPQTVNDIPFFTRHFCAQPLTLHPWDVIESAKSLLDYSGVELFAWQGRRRCRFSGALILLPRLHVHDDNNMCVKKTAHTKNTANRCIKKKPHTHTHTHILYKQTNKQTNKNSAKRRVPASVRLTPQTQHISPCA